MRRREAWIIVSALSTVVATMLAFGAYASVAWIVCTVTTLGTITWCLERFYAERGLKHRDVDVAKILKTVTELEDALAEMKGKLGQFDMALSRQNGRK